MEIQIRLEKLKISKTTFAAFKQLVVPEKYLYHIL